jgi:hypothetical protein
MKGTPAFDSPALQTPENRLFGDATTDRKHFTQFAQEHSSGASIADPAIVKMMNPMNYIGAEGTTSAPYWRIRHGAVDRDTSLAIPVILATKLQDIGRTVDFAAPWGRGMVVITTRVSSSRGSIRSAVGVIEQAASSDARSIP